MSGRIELRLVENGFSIISTSRLSKSRLRKSVGIELLDESRLSKLSKGSMFSVKSPGSILTGIEPRYSYLEGDTGSVFISVLISSN